MSMKNKKRKRATSIVEDAGVPGEPSTTSPSTARSKPRPRHDTFVVEDAGVPGEPSTTSSSTIRSKLRPRLDEVSEKTKGKQKAKVSAQTSDESDFWDDWAEPFVLPKRTYTPSERVIFWDTEEPLAFLKTNYQNNFVTYIPCQDELPADWPGEEDLTGLPACTLSPDLWRAPDYRGLRNKNGYLDPALDFSSCDDFDLIRDKASIETQLAHKSEIMSFNPDQMRLTHRGKIMDFQPNHLQPTLEDLETNEPQVTHEDETMDFEPDQMQPIEHTQDTISSFSAPSPPSMDIDMDVDIQSDDELCLSQAMDDMSVFTRERSSSIISNFNTEAPTSSPERLRLGDDTLQSIPEEIPPSDEEIVVATPTPHRKLVPNRQKPKHTQVSLDSSDDDIPLRTVVKTISKDHVLLRTPSRHARGQSSRERQVSLDSSSQSINPVFDSSLALPA
ncbi:hypothetical protein BJ912DRAFT_1144309 [Pholiota molesta]|nr:hypothetical protein BJ912DRAFT_1144309 [Pholiota molesta]